MKIVLIGKYNKSNTLVGPEKFALRVFEQIKSKESNVEFIEYFFKKERKSNFFLRLFGKEKDKEITNLFRFGSISLFLYLLKQKPDIIHITLCVRFNLWIYLYKIFLRSSIITTMHGIKRYEITRTDTFKRFIAKYYYYFFERCILKFSDKLVFLSEQQLELAQKFYKINKKKIIFIPNGVDKTFYCESKKNFKNKKLNIVFYNGFDNEIDRGLNNILQALNELTNIEFTLFIIGNNLDDFGKIYNYEIRNFKPMNEIKLIEFLRDKHIFLKSTTYDSFPIMVLECMAAGLIVIISNKVGITSYIKNGKNGFVYSNLSEVKKIIENIYNRNINLSLISDNAKAICIELNWESIGEQYLNLYKVLNRKSN